MTLLGKIFAILCLPFSIAVFVLAAWSYAAGTNWHITWQAEQKQRKAAEGNAQAYAIEAAEAARKADQRVADANREVAKAKGEEDRLAKLVKNLETALALEQKKSKEDVTTVGSTTEELKRREAEVLQLHNLLASRDKKINDLEGQLADLHKSKVKWEMDAGSAQFRSEQLLTNLQNLTRENEKLRAAAGGGVRPAGGIAEKNPPAEDVEGIVKAYDPESSLVTISLGSDHGLAVGNTLDVFRYKPQPLYLGTLRLLNVRPNEAVAKPMGKLYGPIQLGDRVASVGSRR